MGLDDVNDCIFGGLFLCCSARVRDAVWDWLDKNPRMGTTIIAASTILVFILVVG
jgi:hypothetical protein